MSSHTQAAATSVRLSIVVEAPIERAFSVFTEDFDHIKPREHNMLGVEIAETVFERRVGGRVYDRGVDGSECQWARVLAFEPPNRVVFSWDISPQCTTIASRNTAAASPKPNSFTERSLPSMNDRNTQIMIAAAALITRPVNAMPSATAVRASPRRTHSSRTRETRNTS